MRDNELEEELKKLTEKQLSTQEKEELIVRICANLCPELSQSFYGLVVRYEKKIKALEEALTVKSKKEQAFDIIKKKGLGNDNLRLAKETINYEQYLDEAILFINKIILDANLEDEDLFTREEYDLLKEVL